MNNLLPSGVTMHLKFDLKGSTFKRKVITNVSMFLSYCQASKHERAKKSPTFKDLDFLELVPDGFHLEPETYTALMSTIERDCRVLESFDIMDYSLLLAVHNLDEAKRENDKSEVAEHEKKRSFQPNTTKLVAHSTPMESIQAYFFFYYLFALLSVSVF